MSNEKLTARILIVDDEVTTCQYIDRHLQMEENLITTCDFAHNIEEAIDKIDTDSPKFLNIIHENLKNELPMDVSRQIFFQ